MSTSGVAEGRQAAGATRVVLLFTGGTISMIDDPEAGGGAVPTLDAAAILARTPGLADIASVEAVDRGLVPASHFTFGELLDLAAELSSRLADPAIAGAVVVQGTDTIEETSFLFDLTVAGPKARRRHRRHADVG